MKSESNIFSPLWLNINFLKRLSRMNFKSVFCANLLEHVTNREEIARILVSIIPVGGYLFISCPFKCPKHPDPIDTMFRPTVQELASLFPNTEIVCGKIVIANNTYLRCLARSPLTVVKTFIRIFMPFYKPRGWLIAIKKISWFFKRFQVACVVLRKDSDKVCP